MVNRAGFASSRFPPPRGLPPEGLQPLTHCHRGSTIIATTDVVNVRTDSQQASSGTVISIGRRGQNGRSERRIARTVRVEVSLLDSLALKEQTFTENVSAHG